MVHDLPKREESSTSSDEEMKVSKVELENLKEEQKAERKDEVSDLPYNLAFRQIHSTSAFKNRLSIERLVKPTEIESPIDVAL